MLRPFLIVLVVALTAAPASAQILNTLAGFEDRAGWQGEASAFVRLSGGNTDLQSYLLAAAGQWQGDRNRFRLIASYDYAQSNGSADADERIVHLRHNFRLAEHVSTLAFAQASHNAFQDLEVRELLGAGLRFDIDRDEQSRVGAGISAMYEHELRTDESRTETVRMSAFLDVQRELKEYLRFLFVGWYQPSLSEFSDLRASVLAELEVDLAGPLALVIWGSWEHDSRPPSEVEPTDWSLRTGLRASF